jgi:acyl carrier protein
MSIKATVISHIWEISATNGKTLASLTDELVMVDLGLDSLDIAILVTRLEDTLGIDPFTESEITSPPVTLGEFIEIYENASVGP